ncbi:hypothetical protein AnigIFM62618_000542 [Aspergillus niger]|nr:hypothetical protein AnigIFM62618_000542 [Aspergillus niger]
MPPRRSYKKRYEADQTDRPKERIENMTMAEAGRELQRLTRNIMLAKRNIKRWESEHEELIARFYNSEGKIVVPPAVDEKTSVTAVQGESTGEDFPLKGATNEHGQTPEVPESDEVMREGNMNLDEDAQCERTSDVRGDADGRLQELATTATAGCDDQLLPDAGDVGCLEDLMESTDEPKGEEDCLKSALGSLTINV